MHYCNENYSPWVVTYSKYIQIIYNWLVLYFFKLKYMMYATFTNKCWLWPTLLQISNSDDTTRQASGSDENIWVGVLEYWIWKWWESKSTATLHWPNYSGALYSDKIRLMRALKRVSIVNRLFFHLTPIFSNAWLPTEVLTSYEAFLLFLIVL